MWNVNLQILDSTPFSSQNKPFENMLIKELSNKKWPNLAAKWNGVIFLKSNTNIYLKKNLKQQFTYTIELSKFDSSPDKAPHNNPFFLKPLHRIVQLDNVKNPWNNNGYTPLHKAAPFGLFQ